MTAVTAGKPSRFPARLKLGRLLAWLAVLLTVIFLVLMVQMVLMVAMVQARQGSLAPLTASGHPPGWWRNALVLTASGPDGPECCTTQRFTSSGPRQWPGVLQYSKSKTHSVRAAVAAQNALVLAASGPRAPVLHASDN